MSWRWPTVWRDERGGWWRVPLTLMLYVGGVVLGIALHTQANISGLKEAIKSQPVHVQEIVPLIATILITGLGLVGCLVGIRFVHHKPLARVFTDGRSFRFGLALQSATLWTLLWLGFTLPLPGAWEGLVRRTGEIPLAWWPIVFVVTLAAMIVGRTAEEVLFRGYLLTRLAAWVKRPWLAVAMVALSFSIVHRGNPAALTAITLFGIAWGAACIRAGTLAPMIGAHVVHDTLNVLLQPGDPNANASTTWSEVVFIAVALSVWFGWLFWTTRNTPADRIAQQDHCTELPPSVAVSMRRIFRTLHSLTAPVPGGSR